MHVARSQSARLFIIVGVKVIPLDLFKKKKGGNTLTTDGHIGWYSGGNLMVLRWGTYSQKVGIWWYSCGHLVLFRWAFGGIQVGKMWGLFSEMGNPSGPPPKYHLGPCYRQ